MVIEPEKEIVMILAETSTTEAIVTAIRQELPAKLISLTGSPCKLMAD
ncbi:MAG: hypothetical protein ACRKFN_08770 [Desulfitobacterium sp.]